ncbi:MAG: PEP-utilizing enzyme [Acidimicrobiales bacterium]|nr:PEP-utilizing enzyme [Acidimicrobiales bacterium]
MDTTLDWAPPGPGPWQQDSAHNPVAQTHMLQAVYPSGFGRGFEEAFSAYGVLLDRLAMGGVNGFIYHQPQPFDLPGPDGPKDPEWVGAEFGRRVGVAAEAFEKQVWREGLRRWDEELKPASIARHQALDVDLEALDDAALEAHIEACTGHVSDMVYQHHRHNMHALVPVGDFLLQAAAWTGRPPTSLLSVLDGYSPVSNVVAPEMVPALDALGEDDEAREILFSGGDPADVLARLRARVPQVGDYIDAVHFRVLDGFDITSPTIGERPEGLVGRLQVALDVDSDDALQRSSAAAAQIRADVPPEHQAAFDDLLAEARLVYRLRDERGIYSEIPAIGLLRLALLALGRRLEQRGRLRAAQDALEVGPHEIAGLLAGEAPTADEVHERGKERVRRTEAGCPRFLGPPPPPPPPADALPPPLARVMSAVGFIIDGILGQKEEPEGDAGVIIGIPGAQGVVEGPVRLVRSIDDLFDLEAGEVLVTPTTGEAFNSMLHLVSAIVTDHGSFASHAAIVSREMGIPAVVGTADGTQRRASAKRVRVDGTTGQVTILE